MATDGGATGSGSDDVSPSESDSELEDSDTDEPEAVDEAEYTSDEYNDNTGPTAQGMKRPIDVDSDSESIMFPKVRKAMDGSRLKAGDFDDITKGILTTAASIYRCLIVTRAPFPESIVIETKLAKEAWKEACHLKGMAIKLTPSLVKIVSDYVLSVPPLICITWPSLDLEAYIPCTRRTENEDALSDSIIFRFPCG